MGMKFPGIKMLILPCILLVGYGQISWASDDPQDSQSFDPNLEDLLENELLDDLENPPPPLENLDFTNLDNLPLPPPESQPSQDTGDPWSDDVGDDPITLLFTDTFDAETKDSGERVEPSFEIVLEEEIESSVKKISKNQEINRFPKTIAPEPVIEVEVPAPPPLRIPAPGMEFWIMDMLLGRMPSEPISMSLLAFAALVFPWYQGRRRRALGR